jgi:hypothetical protein
MTLQEEISAKCDLLDLQIQSMECIYMSGPPKNRVYVIPHFFPEVQDNIQTEITTILKRRKLHHMSRNIFGVMPAYKLLVITGGSYSK